MYYADSMVFFAEPGEPPILASENTAHQTLGLAHLTSAPPLLDDFNETLGFHREFKAQALRNPGVYHVRSGGDLDRKGTGLIFGLQHAPTKMTAGRVCKLAAEGVRAMALTNGQSEYGGASDGLGGLTKAGKELIQWMGQADIVLDLVHANNRSACEAIRFIKAGGFRTKVMVSHCQCRALKNNLHSVTDELLDELREVEGYIGIPIPRLPKKLTDEDGVNNFSKDVMGAINRFAEHVIHGVLKSGDDTTIGIGSNNQYYPGLYSILEEKLGYLPYGVFGENFKNFLKRALPW